MSTTPTRGDGPEPKPKAAVMQLPAAITHIVTPPTDASKTPMAPAPVEVTAGAGGLLRTVTNRDVTVACTGCKIALTSTGPGASHSRRTGHRVQVAYYAEFYFEPGGAA